MSKTIYPAMLLCDMYKLSHRQQYPKKTEMVYSTWTPRASLIEGIDKVIAFGFQGFIKKYLIDYFDEHFFKRSDEEIAAEYVRYIKYTLGVENPDLTHILQLHALGYLPIRIKAVAEGTAIPLRVPMLTIENTKPHAFPEFFWLTNYLETLMSSESWQPSTAATIANKYYNILYGFAMDTVGEASFVPFQGHDFSFRGMLGLEAAAMSGAAHLTSFVGTDSIPAIGYLEEYYNANIEKELVGCSVPASEHSVMCAHGRDEMASYKYLINEVYPKGIISIVSDTWDLWAVLNNVIRELKDDIMARDGKVVIRPDSGDPVDIICGTVSSVIDVPDDTDIIGLKVKYQRSQETEEKFYRMNGQIYRLYNNEYAIIVCEPVDLSLQQKGVIEILWEIFGGTVSEKGYKVLDSHIGAIYGDAITLLRCKEICQRLKDKGFASTNIVFGIGSFTYQYLTRDSLGFALKSTFIKVNGKEINIYKDPVTDVKKIKKSQTGLVCVVDTATGIKCLDGLSIADRDAHAGVDLLRDIFVDGKLIIDDSLANIRQRLADQREDA